MNHLRLDAAVIEREGLRYTPAGMPITTCLLRHGCEVIEANLPRQVEMMVQALAAGEMASALQGCEFGVNFRFSGFLAPRNRNSRTLIFHITEIQFIVDSMNDLTKKDST